MLVFSKLLGFAITYSAFLDILRKRNNIELLGFGLEILHL